MKQISESNLMELEKKNRLEGYQMERMEFCDHCVLEKSHKLKFETSKHVPSRPFMYVHVVGSNANIESWWRVLFSYHYRQLLEEKFGSIS